MNKRIFDIQLQDSKKMDLQPRKPNRSPPMKTKVIRFSSPIIPGYEHKENKLKSNKPCCKVM